MGTNNSTIYKIVRTVIILLSLFAVVGFFFGLRGSKHDELCLKKKETDSSILINVSGVKYISSKFGVKQWILKASHMCIDKERKKIFACNPEIEFFLENDSFYLSAGSGLINNSSNRINLFDNVCVQGWNFSIEADHAEYFSDAITLTSEKAVVFFDNDFSVRSNSLLINLKRELFQFDGNIKGRFKNTS